MKKSIKYYDLLSPDGFSIERDKIYKGIEEVNIAFDKWKKNFVRQGYYSSNEGRILLEDLEDYCELIEVK